MTDYRLGAVERRFADLIWQHAPISSGELVRLCEKGIRELLAKQREILED